MIKDSERHKKRLTPAEREQRLMDFLHRADRFYGRMLWASCIIFILLLVSCMYAPPLAVPLVVLFLLVGVPTMFLILANKFIRFAGALRRLIEKLTYQERR